MNKNTAKAIKVVKAYMKRTGAEIFGEKGPTKFLSVDGWGNSYEGTFLTLYLAAHGITRLYSNAAVWAFEEGPACHFCWGFEGEDPKDHHHRLGFFFPDHEDNHKAYQAGAQARAAFKKELGL